MGLESVLEWVKKDFVVIIVCCLCLLACLYTIYSVASYQEQINNAWERQWNESGCYVKPYVPSIPYNLWGQYGTDQDTSDNT